MRRGRRELAGDDGGVFGVQLVTTGREAVTHGGSSIVLQPGDVLVWDGSRPIEAEAITSMTKCTLILSRDPALAAVPGLGSVVGRPLTARAPAVRQAAGFIERMAAASGSADAPSREDWSRAAWTVVRGLVADRGLTGTLDRLALHRAVLVFIDERLADPALSPRSIARAHAISLRALYALFDGEHESVAGAIRRRRLERCHAELAERRTASVTEVAYRWGFQDAAHFSRTFKRHFGITPSSVRAAAVA